MGNFKNLSDKEIQSQITELRRELVDLNTAVFYGDGPENAQELYEAKENLVEALEEELAKRAFVTCLRGANLDQLKEIHADTSFSESLQIAVEIEICWRLHEKGLDLRAAA